MRLDTVVSLAALGLTIGGRAAATDLTWRLDARDGSVSTHQFTYSAADARGLRGSVVWDPFIYLRLPPGGLDTSRMKYLEVRLYSSAPADLLDVYYQAPNGDWALMGRHPVVRGWATYCMDLSTLTGHEGAGSAQWQRWGGSEHRAISFRIDPGNQADRWVAISRVRLTDEPLTEGVTEEARGTLASIRLSAPPRLSAGSPVRASATIQPGAGAPARYTAYVRLLRGAAIIADHEEQIDGTLPSVRISASFPTSRYLPSGTLTLSAGTYELDGPASSTSMGFRNLREGAAKPPHVEVRRAGGDPVIVVDGKPLAGMAYLTAAGRRVAEHAEFARAGIHLYTDWFGSSGSGNLGHIAPDRYDYGEFDAYFADILDADPNARFIPHIYVTPPMWWQQANPAEMCRYADGGLGGQSFASAKWRTDIGGDLRRLIAHLQSTSYADRILGYILCSGHTAEWQQWGIWDAHLADYSEPQRRGFLEWRRRHGRTDAPLPTPEERSSSTAFGLRDPTRQQTVIDYYQYASETIADAIAYFARIVKQASGGRSLAGSYYGYLTQHGPHQQDSGHLALARLLDAPEIDFLMSPPMYTGREAGGTSTFMSAVGSVRLHGKLWLNESDIRTSLSDPGADFSRADTLAKSRAILQREFGEMLAHRSAISWFDMGGGWFSHQAILADMAQMQKLAAKSIALRQPFRGEIAVFISAESAYRMAPGDLWIPAVQMPVVDLPRVGVPADVYLLSDINRQDFPRYKVYVFLNAVYVDAQTRQSIDAKVKRGGAMAVWLYAPGVVTDAGPSTESMWDLTGISIGMEMREAVQQVRRSADAVHFPDLGPMGWDKATGPVFWAEDPSAEVIGRLTEGGRAGLVRKPMAGWTSVYYAGIGFPPGLLRELAREAGAHVYLDTGDALDTDGQWACIHARTAGPKRLRLPTACRVEDAMTGKVIATRARAVTIPIREAETVLLRLTPVGTPDGGPARRRAK